MRIEEFDYELPAAAIGQVPIEPRDASRLLIVGDPPIDTTFAQLPEHLRSGDLLVVNATRVRAARLHGIRPTGGRVELLLLTQDRDEWDVLARPARKLSVGMNIGLGDLAAQVVAVTGEGRARVRLQNMKDDGRSVEEVVAQIGTVPYPPYITTGPADPERYQTVYASAVGSAAAPTAGLHFTQSLLDEIKRRGVRTAHVFLDIGLDTFQPITAATVEEHEMHTERYEVPARTVAALEKTWEKRGRVVAVGTTVVRALESAASDGSVRHGSGRTDLFIRPGYQPRMVDAVLTNFHMPRSSLVVMIAALLPEWRRLYSHALENGYRFLSFGDAMFIPEVR